MGVLRQVADDLIGPAALPRRPGSRVPRLSFDPGHASPAAFTIRSPSDDVWLQAAAGSGSGQTAVKSSPTAIPTEISRDR
jgi:hypothetical protein